VIRALLETGSRMVYYMCGAQMKFTNIGCSALNERTEQNCNSAKLRDQAANSLSRR